MNWWKCRGGRRSGGTRTAASMFSGVSKKIGQSEDVIELEFADRHKVSMPWSLT